MLERHETTGSSNQMLEKVRIEDAVGLILAHDLTEIRPGEYKGPAFRKGHRIESEDLCHLMRLGKRHIYILHLEEDQMHEDDAVLELAEALSGPGITYGRQPREGKLQLEAAHDGLFKVKVDPLVQFNLIPEVMCASIHTDTPVKQGQKVAGTRAIPLVVDRTTVRSATDIARAHHPVISVKRFKRASAALIITGNEIYSGLIKDKFEPVVRRKLQAYGSSLIQKSILPDEPETVAGQVRKSLDAGADLVITTGGMSVDPDDVTRHGIRLAGVDRFHYGAAVLPGAMFLLAYKGDIPIVGIPACALYHQTTVFDLILPKLLAGEKPDEKDLARLAHGGFCNDCPTCSYPACSFGKSG